MIIYHPESSAEIDAQVIAHRWKQDFEKALRDCFLDKDSTLEDVAAIVVDEAILNRLAPLDPAVLAARKEVGSETVAGGRSDPKLYYETAVNLMGFLESVRTNATMMPGWVFPLLHVLESIQRDTALCKKYFSFEVNTTAEQIERLARAFLTILEDRARKNGIEEFPVFPPVGTKITYHGVSATIEMYRPDGLIQLKVNDSSQSGVLNGYLGASFGGMDPAELLSDTVRVE